MMHFRILIGTYSRVYGSDLHTRVMWHWPVTAYFTHSGTIDPTTNETEFVLIVTTSAAGGISAETEDAIRSYVALVLG